MKKIVVRHAMMAACCFFSITITMSVRASDLAEQKTSSDRSCNISVNSQASQQPFSHYSLQQAGDLIREMDAESQLLKAQIGRLTRELRQLGDVQSRLSVALRENETLVQELEAMKTVQKNARSIEELYLKEHQRANKASSERDEARMHTAPYLEREVAELRQQASKDAKIIQAQAATIQTLRSRLSLRRL